MGDAANVELLAKALEKLLPAARYGASVACGISKPGYSAMAGALKDTEKLLMELRPGALLCRQSDHAFDRAANGRCARCRGDQPPSGPFTWSIEDVAADVSRSGQATTEKGAKNGCTRALQRFSETGRAVPRPGLYTSVIAPDGRRWEVDPEWQGGCSYWREALPR
jgi:hypothetical protein